MSQFWDTMTISDLKESYPTANKGVLERFLQDVTEDYKTINTSSLEWKYPQELLSNDRFMAVIANADFYQTGQAEAMYAAYIDEHTFQCDWSPEDFEIYNTYTPENKQRIRQQFNDSHEELIQELKTIEQMTDFYEQAVKDSIAAFKNENPSFKDVQIPYFHPPMPDYFPDVIHNGKTIEAECLGHQTVQATQFCLMKDNTDVKNPYFVVAYRIDKIDDPAGYKVQNLNTRSLTEAKSMFADVVAGRPPKGLSIKEKMEAAIAKSAARQARNPDNAINKHSKLYDSLSVTK